MTATEQILAAGPQIEDSALRCGCELPSIGGRHATASEKRGPRTREMGQ